MLAHGVVEHVAEERLVELEESGGHGAEYATSISLPRLRERESAAAYVAAGRRRAEAATARASVRRERRQPGLGSRAQADLERWQGLRQWDFHELAAIQRSA